MEPVPVVASLLHLGDALGDDAGEEGDEGHDGGARHELGDAVHALVNLGANINICNLGVGEVFELLVSLLRSSYIKSNQ